MKTPALLLAVFTIASPLPAAPAPALAFPPQTIGTPPLRLMSSALPAPAGQSLNFPADDAGASAGSRFLSRATANLAPPDRSRPALAPMPVLHPRTDVDYKLRIVAPNPAVDYKLIIVGGQPEPQK